ncbi:MAG: DUF2889 domain-containing protein [Steroidobacteraceae bacterium]
MLPPNPDFGTGLFRRRVRLRVAAHAAHVDLEDGVHAFRVSLRHDGARITAIEPTYVRHPFTTCPESASHLLAYVGRPLASIPDLRRALEKRHSCTHVTDMTALALAHVGEEGLTRLYDIVVDDEREGRTRARISSDGRAVHDWTLAHHLLVEPRVLVGRPVMQGFHAWASETFAGSAFEAALMLQRGYFVAQTRRFVITPVKAHPAIGDGMPDGVCYSYSTPVVQRAERIDGNRRDFTHDPDAMLRFDG